MDPDKSHNGKRICGLNASVGMGVADTYFQYKDVHRNTWYRHREDSVKNICFDKCA